MFFFVYDKKMKDSEFIGGKLKLKGVKIKKTGNKKSDKKKHTKNDQDKYDIKKKTDHDHPDRENYYNSNGENGENDENDENGENVLIRIKSVNNLEPL